MEHFAVRRALGEEPLEIDGDDVHTCFGDQFKRGEHGVMRGKKCGLHALALTGAGAECLDFRQDRNAARLGQTRG